MGLIGTDVAARRLGVSPRRVAAMIQSGMLPAQKIGRTWVLDEAEVEKLRLKERKPGRPPKRG